MFLKHFLLNIQFDTPLRTLHLFLHFQGYQDEELLCSSSLNVIIAGIDPLISAPVVQFPATKSQFVSLAVTITTEFTVLFLGTSVGHIRKVCTCTWYV